MGTYLPESEGDGSSTVRGITKAEIKVSNIAYPVRTRKLNNNLKTQFQTTVKRFE
jgi:hypothetical protein